MWLRSSETGAAPDDVDHVWQAFLRRFDLEHTFRFAKQTLDWTTPKLRTSEGADHWTWIPIVSRTQLRLALVRAEFDGSAPPCRGPVRLGPGPEFVQHRPV